jgi:hypothetical protein
MKWTDNNNVGSLLDIGKRCTIRMAENRYVILDWYKDDDGTGHYLINGSEITLGWEPVVHCNLVDREPYFSYHNNA